jgi:hypothetical protein
MLLPVEGGGESLLGKAPAYLIDETQTHLQLLGDFPVGMELVGGQQNAGAGETAGAGAPLAQQRLQLVAIPIAQLHDMLFWIPPVTQES